MPRLFPFFLLLTQLGAVAQADLADPQSTDRYPFQSLGVPDTLVSSAEVQELQRRCDVLRADDLSYSTAEEPDYNERRLVLLKTRNDRWLVYPIAEGSQREGYSDPGPWDERYFVFTAWTSNIIRSHETAQHALVFVDPERATYAAIPTYVYENHWEPVDGSEEVTTTVTKDSTSVHFTPTP